MTDHLRTKLARDGIPPAFFDRRLIELRELGLPYTSIAKVVRFYESWFVTTEQVRSRLRELGDAPNEAKRRAALRQARARWKDAA